MVVRPEDQRRVTYGAGDSYRFVATGGDTDDAYVLFEAVVPRGGGPPPHIQNREEELFYILEGEITFFGQSGAISAPAGTMVNIPKGAPHRFRNEGDVTARMLMLFAPAGIEQMFYEMDEIDDDDIHALAEAAGRHGVEFVSELG